MLYVTATLCTLEEFAWLHNCDSFFVFFPKANVTLSQMPDGKLIISKTNTAVGKVVLPLQSVFLSLAWRSIPRNKSQV